ncbi:ribonuclease H-like domain-containing protein [Aspergillus floccosus]
MPPCGASMRRSRQKIQRSTICSYDLLSCRKEHLAKLKPGLIAWRESSKFCLPHATVPLGLVRTISSCGTDPSRPRPRTQTTRLPNGPISTWEDRRYFSSSTARLLSDKDTNKSEKHSGSVISVNTPTPTSPAKFWSHQMYKRPDGGDITVHYCRSLKSAEDVAQHFLHDEILGFDLEWKAQASALDSIQNNVSLVQIANRERIALFHIAMFRPGIDLADLVAPSLRAILESPRITKVGVSIKADSTRVRKYLGINTRAIFELSHLHKLVKYCYSNPRLINKRLVNLSEQVEEHFGLPLAKEDDVRCGDWMHALNYRQVQYAASDPYACLCLFYAMDAKRKALDPVPPLPAHAELDIPIRIVHDAPVQTDLDEVEVVRPAGGPVAKTIS